MTTDYKANANLRGKWTHLELTDRASGEVERINLGDENSAVSITSLADKLDITRGEAWGVLLDGGHLATLGFVYRLVVVGTHA